MTKKKMTFEEAMNRLEEIAQTLEQEQLPLEESLKLYEEGTGLAAFCSETLKNAQQRVTEINTDAKEAE